MTGRLIPRAELSATQVGEMQELLAAHFDGVNPGVFERDLRQKNWVIVLEDEVGAIRGFSSLLHYRTTFEGEPVSVVFSGDTIVQREFWGTPELPRTWIRSVNRLGESYPGDRLFWLLICSGVRTYRFLPLFWNKFHPRYDAATPPDVERLLHALATERFAGAYRPAQGIVRFEFPQVLRGDLLATPRGRVKDPHAAFFADRNPGHVRGDELVCLTEVRADNLTSAGRRMLGPDA